MRVPGTPRRSDQSILKEINPEYSLEGTDAKVEAPILWPPGVKSQLIGNDSDVGKDRKQKEKVAAKDQMLK